MNIIQTFWSGGHDVENFLSIKGGWAFPEYNWMSWALSALLLRRHYEEVELYTDKEGKRILVDLLELPYTKVHVVFDENFKIHPKLFSLAKIKTYSLQEEPFIHIDGDVFLWSRFPKAIMNADLIASNPELNLHFNNEILNDMEAHFQYIPTHLKGVSKNEAIFSSNAGIFGGSNISFIKKYCSKAQQLISANENNLEKVNIGYVNMLIEQVSLFYLAAQDNIDTTYYVDEPVTHPLYKDYWRFADVPEVPMVHPVGGCKQIPYVLYHLGRRLQMEFPEAYYRIIGLCKNHDIPLIDRLYAHLNLNVSKTFADANIFRDASNFSALESLKPTLHETYSRTRRVMAHYYPQMKFAEKDLERIVSDNKSNTYLEEIYTLETQTLASFESLLLAIKKGKIYQDEVNHYKNTASFIKDANWLKRKVALKDELACLELTKPWVELENPEVSVSEVLDTKDAAYCVTLSIALTAFRIHEGYYYELDAIIIKSIQKPMNIEDLLAVLTKYFDEDIAISNPAYQLLIFDILKRLAFENIIVILS
ncbi:hypothetical protein N9954_08925 [Maribacter sp.]|nr:hypothetical protein [Maribacter sp.]